jgi:uncharacterized protein YjbI with pentapeptide repeats
MPFRTTTTISPDVVHLTAMERHAQLGVRFNNGATGMVSVLRVFLVMTLVATCLNGAFAQRNENFRDKDLSGRHDLANRQLDGADFQDSILKGTWLSGTSLKGANFKDADLSGAWMNGADLQGVDFTSALIKGTWFEKANLTGANFADADLGGGASPGAIFRCANLRNATGFSDLRGADLRQADIRGANLSPNRSDALQWVGGIRLKGALYDERTRWPKGFDVEGSGAVKSDTPERTAACERGR